MVSSPTLKHGLVLLWWAQTLCVWYFLVTGAFRYDFLTKLKSLRRDKAGLLHLNAVLMGISLDGVRTGLICLLRCFLGSSAAHTWQQASRSTRGQFVRLQTGDNKTMSTFTCDTECCRSLEGMQTQGHMSLIHLNAAEWDPWSEWELWTKTWWMRAHRDGSDSEWGDITQKRD